MTRLAGIIVDRQNHPAFARGWEMFIDGEDRPYDDIGNFQSSLAVDIAELTIEGWDAAAADAENEGEE
jgi:hypothetical protein